MLKQSLSMTISGTISPWAGIDNTVHTFCKGISLKVDAITWVEFELKSTMLQFNEFNRADFTDSVDVNSCVNKTNNLSESVFNNKTDK